MISVSSTEKDRFSSRLSSIQGVHPLPSIGDWILLRCDTPSDLARRVNRRLFPGAMSVPRGIDSAVRIHVADPKANEAMLKTIRDVIQVA
ncbi:MAG: hypothetical protein AAF368_04225 [Planctomycetota bacterium]